MAAILCKLGFSETVVRSKMAAGTSTFVLAYAIHKLFAPVRISITLVSVPLIVRYFRKTGLFKPPTPSPWTPLFYSSDTSLSYKTAWLLIKAPVCALTRLPSSPPSWIIKRCCCRITKSRAYVKSFQKPEPKAENENQSNVCIQSEFQSAALWEDGARL